MEGLALTLIGASLFSHSWHLLGLYSEGRTIGFIMAVLGGALLITLTMQPQLLGLQGTNSVTQLGEVTMMRTLIILWAIYAGAVAAHGWWDLEERAIGFYSVLLTAGSAVAIFFFATELWDHDSLPGVDAAAVTISMAGAATVLTALGAILFFYMAIPFNALRAVAGWFLLIGSVVIAAIGLAIITTVIAY